MDRIERLYQAKAAKKREMSELADDYAIEVAREVDAGRETETGIARRLGISQPAVARTVRLGRALIAAQEEKASSEEAATAA